MSVTFRVPHQARFITSRSVIVGMLNIPTIGKYNFDYVVNKNVFVTELVANSVYLIDKIAVGGNVAEEVFLDSIADPVNITFKTKKGNEFLYKYPYPVLKYTQGWDLTAFSFTNQNEDSLLIDATGILEQTSQLIGVASIIINVSFGIYAIDSTLYRKYYSMANSEKYGEFLTK